MIKTDAPRADQQRITDPEAVSIFLPQHFSKRTARPSSSIAAIRRFRAASAVFLRSRFLRSWFSVGCSPLSCVSVGGTNKKERHGSACFDDERRSDRKVSAAVLINLSAENTPQLARTSRLPRPQVRPVFPASSAVVTAMGYHCPAFNTQNSSCAPRAGRSSASQIFMRISVESA